MRKFCAGHQEAMGAAVKRAGLGRYINAARARKFAARWILGKARKEELDPLVIMMLELTAKAQRMGLRHESSACPLCAIVKIENERPRAAGDRPVVADVDKVVIDGMTRQVIIPLFVSNGLKAA